VASPQTLNILKDERPTSNNDVAPLLKLIQHGMKKQCRTLNDYFLFSSLVLILVTKILINSCPSLCLSFIIGCSTFDVRCSFTFSIHSLPLLPPLWLRLYALCHGPLIQKEPQTGMGRGKPLSLAYRCSRQKTFQGHRF